TMPNEMFWIVWQPMQALWEKIFFPSAAGVAGVVAAAAAAACMRAPAPLAGCAEAAAPAAADSGAAPPGSAGGAFCDATHASNCTGLSTNSLVRMLACDMPQNSTHCPG